MHRKNRAMSLKLEVILNTRRIIYSLTKIYFRPRPKKPHMKSKGFSLQSWLHWSLWFGHVAEAKFAIRTWKTVVTFHIWKTMKVAFCVAAAHFSRIINFPDNDWMLLWGLLIQKNRPESKNWVVVNQSHEWNRNMWVTTSLRSLCNGIKPGGTKSGF